MMATTKIPRGWYGPNRDGLLDPDRITPQERATARVDRLNAEHERRTSASPVLRRLQAVTDKALGRKVTGHGV